MLYKICYLDIPSILSQSFYVCTTKEDIIYWMSVKMSWMKSKLNINIGIILLILKIFLSFSFIQQKCFCSFSKNMILILMVLEYYCLLSRRRHVHDHRIIFPPSSLYSPEHIYTKKKHLPQWSFCPFWSDHFKQRRMLCVAETRGEEKVNVFQSSS